MPCPGERDLKAPRSKITEGLDGEIKNGGVGTATSFRDFIPKCTSVERDDVAIVVAVVDKTAVQSIKPMLVPKVLKVFDAAVDRTSGEAVLACAG